MLNTRYLLRMAGSLWFAVVLLALLMLSMASATVFESMYGTERALSQFYHSLWFRTLLALVAVNVLAAVILRYPFSRRQVGFVATHAGILLALAGALVTDQFGVDGRLGIAEGQTVKDFSISRNTLTVTDTRTFSKATMDLDPSVFGGFSAVERPEDAVLALEGGAQSIKILQYLPDLVWRENVLNDNPEPQPAVEVALSENGRDDPAWIFEGRTARLGTLNASFRLVTDRKEFSRLLPEGADESNGSKGTVKVEYGGASFEFPLEDCMDEPITIGDSGYAFRVLRYLPHAVVGQDNQLTSASEQPVNPAIEAEITGPEGSEKRPAFAKFPDFRSMHGSGQYESIKLTFITPASNLPRWPVEVFSGPEGDLFVRFFWEGSGVVGQRIEVGTPVETPWPGRKFAVLRRYKNARIERTPVQPDPVRKNREPSLRLKWTGPEQDRELWLQKYRPRTVTIGNGRYELLYGDKAAPLGFEVRLNRFRIGYYPGGETPRSFESHITITDPSTGRSQDRIVSMNNPTSHGGYTFYQSSYRLESDRAYSILSVSRDPGQLIAFAGYIATILGIILVLATRMREQRLKKERN